MTGSTAHTAHSPCPVHNVTSCPATAHTVLLPIIFSYWIYSLVTAHTALLLPIMFGYCPATACNMYHPHTVHTATTVLLTPYNIHPLTIQPCILPGIDSYCLDTAHHVWLLHVLQIGIGKLIIKQKYNTNKLCFLLKIV